MFVMLIAVRLMHLITTGRRFSKQQHLFVEHFIKVKGFREQGHDHYEAHEHEHSDEGMETITNVFRYALHIAVYIAVVVLYVQSDYMKNQNMMSKLWIQVEMISGVVEWPFIIW